MHDFDFLNFLSCLVKKKHQIKVLFGQNDKKLPNDQTWEYIQQFRKNIKLEDEQKVIGNITFMI